MSVHFNSSLSSLVFNHIIWFIFRMNSVTTMLVADVGDQICWWRFWDVGDRFNITKKFCHQHNDVTNITVTMNCYGDFKHSNFKRQFDTVCTIKFNPNGPVLSMAILVLIWSHFSEASFDLITVHTMLNLNNWSGIK